MSACLIHGDCIKRIFKEEDEEEELDRRKWEEDNE